MRFLVTADIQAAEKTDRCFENPAIPLQRWRVKQFYDWLYEKAKELRVDGIIDAGDTTDRRDAIALPTIDTIMSAGARFSDMFRCNIKVQGNHDHHVRDGSIHNGEMFARDYTVVSDSVVTLRLEDHTAITCAPFTEDVEKLTRELRRESDPSRICIGHFGVVGAEMNGSVSQSGVPLSALEGYAFTILGHIHKPQTLGNVHYVGSPFQQDYGEADEEKRVALIDTAKRTLEWIPTDGPTYRVMSLKRFSGLKRCHPEDRFRILVNTIQEASMLATMPFGKQAEPVFPKTEEQSTDCDTAPTEWNLDRAVRAWVKANPYSEFQHPRRTDSDDLTEEDLVTLALDAFSS